MSSKRPATEESSRRKAKKDSAESVVAPASALSPTAISAPAPSVDASPAKRPAGNKRKEAPSEAEAPKKSESKNSKRESAAPETAPATGATGATGATAATDAPVESKEPSAKRQRKNPASDSKEAKEAKPRSKASKKDSSATSAAANATGAAATPAATAPSVNTNKAQASGEAEAEAGAPADTNPCISRYLRLLMKERYGDSTISKDAIQEVQRLVYRFGFHFLVAVHHHLQSARKNTLMPQDMPICLQRSLASSGLYNEFAEAVSAACNKYDASVSSKKQEGEGSAEASTVSAVDEKRKQMWAARAGLSIPPTRVKDFVKTYLPQYRFSQSSITGLTALFEVLSQRIFKLSYEKAGEASRKRISQSDVNTSVRGDSQLTWLMIEPVAVAVQSA